MKHQFTITVDTPDATRAGQVREEAVSAIEDFIERYRPKFTIDCGSLNTVDDPDNAGAIAAAREIHEDEGTLEIDENAVVSFSADGGAYVAAWVWVDDAALKTHGVENPQSAPAEDAVESEGGHCD